MTPSDERAAAFVAELFEDLIRDGWIAPDGHAFMDPLREAAAPALAGRPVPAARPGFKKREAALAKRLVAAIEAMHEKMLAKARLVDLIESAADLREDGWVTINGTHVFIGKGGDITKGPAGLVGKSVAAGGGKPNVAAIVGKGGDLSKSFNLAGPHQIVALDGVISTKDEAAAAAAAGTNNPVDRAAQHMADAIDGTNAPRAPILVTAGPNGTMTVVDGHATVQAAKAAGWETVAVREIGAHEAALNVEAQAINTAAKAELPVLTAKLTAAVADQPGATVSARAKTVDSIVEKLLLGEQTDPGKNNSPSALWDSIGARAQFATQAQANAAADAVRANFTIVREKDYVANPVDGYRGLHFNVKQNGISAEIQVRTANQTRWSDWMHEQIYKPHGSPEQVAAVKANRPAIIAYAKQMSEYYHTLDVGQSASKPGCGSIVSSSVGCL
ncbi:MAG: hypothetical protein NVSMB19_23150 [Vulcanimicrobiaceae bacterium]